MNSAMALAVLRALNVPLFTTADARAAFGGTMPSTSKTLARLAAVGLVVGVRRGLWTLNSELDPLLLPDYLTAPAPSYVSLQTALYRRGLIEQIPAVIFAVTLGKPQRLNTAFGTYSMHRIAPELFGGFEVLPNGAKLATAEKALVDLLYLSGSRQRYFAALPEIQFPRGFKKLEVERWLRCVPTTRLRTLAESRWVALKQQGRAPPARRPRD